MSSPSESSTITHVVIGEGRCEAIEALLQSSGRKVRQLRLNGVCGEGRALLEALAAAAQVVFTPWPASDASHVHHRAAVGPAEHGEKP